MGVLESQAEAERYIESFGDAVMDHATKAKRESDLEADRCNIKGDAIRRIMAETNPLTGKPHSASSAEAVVGSDPEYRAYLAMQSETVFTKNLARGAVESYKLRTLLAISLINAQSGVV